MGMLEHQAFYSLCFKHNIGIIVVFIYDLSGKILKSKRSNTSSEHHLDPIRIL